ncbi:MAG: DEAD/DEAH box helicase, partial [Oscillospiraceae bacterium]|nr:DEAD/DEAH box helicase [Oscillospiraceae bacterium]
MNAFERLSPFIQDFIYRKGWQELRPIQLAACEAIFHSKEHLLLSSGTASGKTEAAFLPVLTLLGEDPPRSVGILYVSPLKALINDQFVRLAPLLEEGKIPVCKWHGDASRGGKQRVLRSPAGVVQITPESLESLLRRPKDCQRLFCDLRFIIIDEVHHFMANERGMQLQCLLERLERLACCQPRRIGLSATVGDATQAKAWLCAGSARGCIHPKAPDARRRLQIWMEYFEREEEPDFDDRAALLPREDGKLAQFLFAQTLGKKSIIFTNSRMEAEGTIAGLKRIAQERKAPNVYRVHHGSISAALREEAEREMKQGNRPFVTAATLTLELGLDIGDLDRVLQMGAPVSVSSLVQRIGRCGRQGQVAQLLFAFQEDAAELPEDPLNSFHWGMIKAIAMLELYLGERWIEPTTENRFPFGILYHQTMSVLLANGGVLSPKRLAQEVLTLHAFRYITREDFQCLLRHLIEIGHLQRGETGELMIGLEAEPIITGHDFLSVFTTSQEYPVRYNGKEIGILNAALQPGERIVLAGQSWECI